MTKREFTPAELGIIGGILKIYINGDPDHMYKDEIESIVNKIMNWYAEDEP